MSISSKKHSLSFRSPATVGIYARKYEKNRNSIFGISASEMRSSRNSTSFPSGMTSENSGKIFASSNEKNSSNIREIMRIPIFGGPIHDRKSITWRKKTENSSDLNSNGRKLRKFPKIGKKCIRRHRIALSIGRIIWISCAEPSNSYMRLSFVSLSLFPIIGLVLSICFPLLFFEKSPIASTLY